MCPELVEGHLSTLRQAQGADPAAVDRQPGVRLPRGRAAAAADQRRDHRTPCTPSTAATSRPGRRGSPLRGLVNVLPTGRNFYSVDPKAIPSRLAYETGQAMAESLLQRHLDETGTYPPSVGLSVWGTSAMRTTGDDIAEVLALLGVVPVWDDASRRVTELEPIPLAELGRPRIDVTVRISGFFRDAFPHVLAMLDDAVRLVADLDEPAGAELRPGARPAGPGRARRPAAGHHPDLRVQAGRVRGRDPAADRGRKLAYRRRSGRGLHRLGRVRVRPRPRRAAGPQDMETNYRRIAVAAKNIDTRRARHRRLRRLLPVPRRHGRHRAGADRDRAEGLRRRLDHARRGARPGR